MDCIAMECLQHLRPHVRVFIRPRRRVGVFLSMRLQLKLDSFQMIKQKKMPFSLSKQSMTNGQEILADGFLIGPVRVALITFDRMTGNIQQLIRVS